jgi:hypothetical protein
MPKLSAFAIAISPDTEDARFDSIESTGKELEKVRCANPGIQSRKRAVVDRFVEFPPRHIPQVHSTGNLAGLNPFFAPKDSSDDNHHYD